MKDLTLSHLFQVNDDLLVKIASRRQNVTEINISDCRGVHDHGVSSLASRCPGLQKYTAYRCKQLGDISLSALASHCPLLVKVHVGNQDKLTDASLKKVHFFAKKKSIKFLFQKRQSFAYLSNSILISCLQLGSNCSELRDIHLGQCYGITDEGMVALVKGCPKLQRLYLQENKMVSYPHFISSFCTCPVGTVLHGSKYLVCCFVTCYLYLSIRQFEVMIWLKEREYSGPSFITGVAF